MYFLTTDEHVESIRKSGLTIYDSIADRPELRYSSARLETLLTTKLNGLLLNQPIRTRSKVVKSAICSALGYPVPKSFRKTQPRFPGQNIDVYVQKSNNLQIWNEELSATRRYILVRINNDDKVVNVRVVTGTQLSKLDTTGTSTRKFQASAISPVDSSRLVSANDTPNLMWQILESNTDFYRQLLPIDKLFVRLKPLLGATIRNPGNDQERNRGWGLHEVVSKQLGLKNAVDDGQVPDVAEQLLELKLQTARTVDLGLVSPGDQGLLENHLELFLADIRYALFYATIDGTDIRLDHLILTSGADFFCFFKRLKGNVVNTKNQIRLPKGFFEK